MTVFCIIAAVLAIVPVSVGALACFRPTGWPETILGYSFYAMTWYTFALGCLWELMN